MSQKSKSFLFTAVVLILVVIAFQFLLVNILLPSKADAEERARFSLSTAIIQGWLDNYDNQNAFINWAESTLTQPQLDSLEAVIAPEPTDEQKLIATRKALDLLESVRMQDSEAFTKLLDEISKIPTEMINIDGKDIALPPDNNIAVGGLNISSGDPNLPNTASRGAKLPLSSSTVGGTKVEK